MRPLGDNMWDIFLRAACRVLWPLRCPSTFQRHVMTSNLSVESGRSCAANGHISADSNLRQSSAIVMLGSASTSLCIPRSDLMPAARTPSPAPTSSIELEPSEMLLMTILSIADKYIALCSESALKSAPRMSYSAPPPLIVFNSPGNTFSRTTHSQHTEYS